MAPIFVECVMNLYGYQMMVVGRDICLGNPHVQATLEPNQNYNDQK